MHWNHEPLTTERHKRKHVFIASGFTPGLWWGQSSSYLVFRVVFFVLFVFVLCLSGLSILDSTSVFSNVYSLWTYHIYPTNFCNIKIKCVPIQCKAWNGNCDPNGPFTTPPVFWEFVIRLYLFYVLIVVSILSSLL